MPSTPQPAFEPRSTIIRASIAGERPVRAGADLQARHLRGRRVRRLEVLGAREDEADRPPQRERGAGGERLDERELASERASERLRDHADALEREVERAGELPLRDERALRARRDDERARRLEPGGADLRLEVRLVDPRRPERPLDDRRRSRRTRAPTSPLSRVMRSRTFAGELLRRVVLLAVVDAGVDRLEVAALVVRLLDRARERRARLHRRLDVDDRRERLVVDDDGLGAVLGGGLASRR